MDKLKDKKVIIGIVIIVIIFISIIIKIKRNKSSEVCSSEEINDNWKINTVDESTNDPFAYQYRRRIC